MRTLCAQLHVKAFFELKDDAHALFEVCRSLGLAGTLRQETHEGGAVPFGARVKINALRLFAAGLTGIVGSQYVYVAPVLPALLSEPYWFSVLFGFAAGAPYAIMGYLLSYDMIESLQLVELCVVVGLGFGVLLFVGVMANMLTLMIALLFIMSMILAAAYVSAKCCAWPATKRSRVAMLCKCCYATALLSPEML